MMYPGCGTTRAWVKQFAVEEPDQQTATKTMHQSSGRDHGGIGFRGIKPHAIEAFGAFLCRKWRTGFRLAAQSVRSHSPWSAFPLVVLAVCFTFLVLLALFIRIEERRLFNEHATTLSRDLQDIENLLSTRVQQHLAYLAALGQGMTDDNWTKLRVSALTHDYVVAWPEVADFCWADANLRVRSAWKREGEVETMSPELTCLLKEVKATHRKTRVAIPRAEEEPRLLIAESLFQQDQFQGVVVLGCSFDQLLGIVSEDMLRRYELCVVDETGGALANRRTGLRHDRRFGPYIAPILAVPGLSLQLVPYETPLARHETLLRYLMAVLGVMLAVGTCALVWDLFKRRRTELELRSSREELRNLSAHLHRVAEQERAEMARDIHDEVGRAMTAMKVGLRWLKKQFFVEGNLDRSAAAERISVLANMADDTLEWAARTCGRLRPHVLDHFGIAAALEWEAAQFQKRVGIRCCVDVPPDEIPLEPEQATTVFRICQESLTNVARHAQATRADIVLRAEGNVVILEVRDDGQGIDAEQAVRSRSFGILGMRERARNVGGILEVYGIPGKGTSVVARIPIASGDAGDGSSRTNRIE